ncbi:MAG: PH domain-containing protein [Saprospiraceae bacterium]|nr:PH domain-containing protein [Saprospiraceae bacterium]
MLKRRNNVDWFLQDNRQAPVAILMIIFNVIKSVIRTWWPILLILFFRSNLMGPDTGKLVVIGGTSLIILISIWRYFRFHFHLSDTKLHVQSGVFTRTKMDIPFDRIQTISFEQNIVHQLFDVTRVKIDTAGSSKEEFEFAALDQDKAEQLRSFILSRKTPTEETTASDVESIERKELLLHLDVGDLIKVGISQNHLRTTGIIVAFLLGLRDRINEALGEGYVDQFDNLAEKLFQNTVSYAIMLFILLIFLSFIGTLIYTVFRYYDLSFYKTNEGYKIQAGLLNKVEQAALDHKIQIVRWVSNPLRKIFNIVHLRLYQASSASGRGSSNITIPGYPTETLVDIKRYVFGRNYLEPETSLGVDRRLFFRRSIFLAGIPSLCLGLAAWYDGNIPLFFIATFWLVAVTIFQFYYQRNWRFHFTVNECIITYGVIERVTKALSLFKVQAIQIKQTPYQRRQQLANIILHTASGDVKIPYIQLTAALEIKNYLLYRIESSTRKWM